jgi:hypothetical protein
MSAAEQAVAVLKPRLNIYQRINEVRKKAAYAKKDKEVAGQGYKAVTHDAVTALLRNHLIEQGIVIVPRLRSSTVEKIGETKGGSPIIRYVGCYDIDFVNCDDPSDKITVPGEAHANDHGDKAPGKATSYATKYAMLKLFSIETGEDDEARVEPYAAPVEKISEKQVADLDALMEEVAADKPALLKHAKIEKLEDMPAKAYQIYVKMLEKKRQKAEAK